MIVLFVLTLLATPIVLLKPLGMKIVIDSGFGSEPLPGFITMFFSQSFSFNFQSTIVIAVAFIILIAILENINGYVSWLLSTYTGEKLVMNFRILLFNHIQRLSIAYHDKKGSSDSLYRIQWDTMCIRSLLLGQLSPLVSSFITLFSMIVVMFIINWSFAIIAICVIPPLYALTVLRSKRLRQDWYKVKDAESNVMSVIHEVLGSLRVVKAFGQEENESERFLKRSNKAVEGQMQMARLGATFQFMVSMVFTIGSVLIIYFGAQYVHAKEMTLGELTLVLAYIGQVFGPLQTISKNIAEIQSSLVSVDRVFSVLDEEKEVDDNPHAIHLDRAKGAFQFKDVSFCYDVERPILKEVSFEVRPGDRVGIMGSTGAGKSTLVSLLNRFYDPSTGVVMVDEVDIKKYKLKDYRSQFSIVLQEPVLFSTTISENIRYGKPGATEKEIIEAAKAANAHDFIIRSKDGYNTMVGERGLQLSGGERQRISIARAFIKNAPILILDEPTSSLDVKTEAQIMEAMERLMEGRTTFMITHRLDTLSSCNFILHLEEGKLVEVVRDHDINYIAHKKASFLNPAV
ncbi:ABC transporter ATP-binding protein [Segetibacter aerophilus]|nr:ABC transporter ATP-binding protein [Segetibacter aerophilus]